MSEGSLDKRDFKMKTIHLIGVHHNKEEEAAFIQQIINDTNPDVIFLELGKHRFSLIKDRRGIFKIMNIAKTRIIDYNVRGRMVSRTLGMKQILSAIRSGTLFKSVNMRPAFEMAPEVNADVIPIDMELHDIMNRLGEETINLSNLQDFRQRFSRRTNNDSLNRIQKFDIDNLNSLREMSRQKREIIPTYHKVMIDDRNLFMVENIQREMQSRDTGVAIVGALHIPGMLDELNARGFDTEVHL